MSGVANIGQAAGSGRDQISTLAREVLDRARRGESGVLFIEGDAGVGKSTLLDEVTQSIDGFTVLSTEAYEGDLASYCSLAGWGIAARPDDPGWATPFMAAQRIRELIEAGPDGPTLLRVDDLHWADTESVQALVALMRRSQGDRLVLAVASRPLGDAHPEWRRWASGASNMVRVTLSGLSLSEAGRLIRSARPDMPEAGVRELWDHTSGNPLYLTSLLAEQDVQTLGRGRVLPAPAEFEETTAARLARLDATAGRLMSALAVLGPGWVPLADAGDVAELTDPDAAADELVASGLARMRELDAVIELRPAHSLVRSAVYHRIPLRDRRALHARAAGVVTGRDVQLGHQVAAASGYDDELAAAAEASAWQWYGGRAFRIGARALRWASELTRDPNGRERRWLDSLYLSALAQDFATVQAELPRVDDAVQDPDRRRLVLACYEHFQGRATRAVQILTAADDHGSARSAGDPDVRYRLECLLAAALILSSADTEQVLAALTRADQLGRQDAAAGALAGYARAIATGRRTGVAGALAQLSMLPDDPRQVPPELGYLRGWRGTLYQMGGWLDRALVDNQVTVAAIRAGREWEFGSGIGASLLGTIHWFRGEWDLAALNMRLATDSADPFLLSIVRAFHALLPTGVGDFDRADEILDRTERMLADSPAPEAAQNLYMIRGVRLHAEGRPDRQRLLLPDFRARWPFGTAPTGMVAAPWLLQAAQSAIWAGELDEARRLVELMEDGSQPGWTEPMTIWLRALIAEAAGRPAESIGLLRSASDQAAAEIPLYQAHLLGDRARLERQSGDPARAEAAAAQALMIYRRLGARPFLDRSYLQPAPLKDQVAIVAGTDEPAGSGTTMLAEHYGLSAREQDVLTLVGLGMSYAQIARELFISNSTVSYHLGKIYAKTGVNSRHQLIGILRDSQLGTVMS